MLPWYLLLVVGRHLLVWPPFVEEGSFLRWLWLFANDTALVLPFLLFAAGVALARRVGYSRRLLRAGAMVGISVVAVSYGLDAWLEPELDDRYLSSLGADTEDMRQFGPRTPVGILRNIRYVEASPPEEYSLRASTPERFPPNVLRWELHTPVAFAAFGLINLLIGVRSAELLIPTHVVHRFRRMPSTDSDPCRPPIPTHVVHVGAPSVGRARDTGVRESSGRGGVLDDLM